MPKEPSARTLAEMQRGRAITAHRALSERFNPDHDDSYNQSEGAKPSKVGREYNRQLAERNKDRWGD